jgi:hypothetical protein
MQSVARGKQKEFLIKETNHMNNNTTYTAKKIEAGVYTYRGWKIERKVWALPKCTEWWAERESDGCDDCYDTLADAKDGIDVQIEAELEETA